MGLRAVLCDGFALAVGGLFAMRGGLLLGFSDVFEVGDGGEFVFQQ